MQQRFVIGISSPTGGGKTTLINQLANVLADAVVLSFDDYDEAGLIIHPERYQTWYQQGADYNAWQAPQLAADLRQLKSGSPVTSPVDQRPVEPANVILFDAPLGRAHQATGQSIDLMVYVDTPLDVALARRTLRDFYGAEPSLSADQSAALRRELEGYLQVARLIYVEFVRQMKSTSDLIVDGLLAPAELANQVLQVAARASAYPTRW